MWAGGGGGGGRGSGRLGFVICNISGVNSIIFFSFFLDPIYTGLVTKVQVLYLLEICCLG